MRTARKTGVADPTVGKRLEPKFENRSFILVAVDR